MRRMIGEAREIMWTIKESDIYSEWNGEIVQVLSRGVISPDLCLKRLTEATGLRVTETAGSENQSGNRRPLRKIITSLFPTCKVNNNSNNKIMKSIYYYSNQWLCKSSWLVKELLGISKKQRQERQMHL